MKRMWLILWLLSAAVLVTGCGGGSGSGGSGGSLADQIAGDFIGILQNPTSGMLSNYMISVERLTDTKVRIHATSGSASLTFEADLSMADVGTVEAIALTVATDILGSNGTYALLNERLAYVVHLGGSSDANLEVFSGVKI